MGRPLIACAFQFLVFFTGCVAEPRRHGHGPDVPPPRPDFKFATELTAATFVEKVEAVTNGSAVGSRPPYYPLVMFHVSWCQHCRHALPEFEKAAEMIHRADKQGSLRNLVSVPQFFLIECDRTLEAKELCEKHTGTSYPVLKLFRDQHAVRFNRPRVSQTMAWWSTHVSRPILQQLEIQAQVESYKQGGATLFVLCIEPQEGNDLLDAWTQIAFDYIEDYHFAVVQPGSEAAKSLQMANLGVTVQGRGLDPLPFTGEMTRESLQAWVNFNRFVPVVELSPYTGHDLQESGLHVVSLVHEGSNDDKETVKQFDQRVKELRPEGKYLFCRINTSIAERRDYLDHVFPLVAPSVSSLPRVFIFSGQNNYWESPSLLQGVADISSESLAALLASSDAHQDDSMVSWLKAKRKVAWRVGTSSFKGFLIVLGMPLGALVCCGWCCRALLADDDEELEKTTKMD